MHYSVVRLSKQNRHFKTAVRDEFILAPTIVPVRRVVLQDDVGQSVFQFKYDDKVDAGLDLPIGTPSFRAATECGEPGMTSHMIRDLP